MTSIKRVAMAVSLSVLLAACLEAPAAEIATTTTQVARSTTTVVDQAADRPKPPSASESRVEISDVDDFSLRVRTVTCGGAVALGSGFAIDENVIVTNRHVVEDAAQVTVNTWDGESIEAVQPEIGFYTDLALVEVASPLPAVGRLSEIDPQAGDEVLVVGFPEGGPLQMTTGKVIDYVREPGLGSYGNVLRITAEVAHGNSGGPLLAPDGSIVGVVYAIEIETGHGLALPASALRRMLDGESATTGNYCD